MKCLCARASGLCVWFGGRQALRDVSLEAPKPGITVLAGRSGSGKTTLLRAMNRLNEEFDGYRGSGRVELDLGRGLEPIYPEPGVAAVRPPAETRRLAGMVFQSPNVLPSGILANVTMPLEHVAGLDRHEAGQKACAAIKATGLWPEVRDRLAAPASSLSGGQQQRLCLARALALEPALLLLDEPTAALDAVSASAIEELLLELAGSRPLVLVSHNPAQACRLASRLVIMAAGRVAAVFDGSLPDPGELEHMLGARPG